jgi:hypothetical protein
MVVLMAVVRRSLKLGGAVPFCLLASHSCCAWLLLIGPHSSEGPGTRDVSVLVRRRGNARQGKSSWNTPGA